MRASGSRVRGSRAETGRAAPPRPAGEGGREHAGVGTGRRPGRGGLDQRRRLAGAGAASTSSGPPRWAMTRRLVGVQHRDRNRARPRA